MSAVNIDNSHQERYSLIEKTNIDGPLLLCLIIICSIGLLMIYSASLGDLGAVYRQALHMGLGLVLLAVIAQIPPYYLRVWTPFLYAAGIAGLLMVYLFGDVGGGAKRWLEIGPVRFQPSEPIKIVLPMMLAWYFINQPLPPRFRAIMGSVCLMAVPIVLILEQPDLGTAVLVSLSGIFVLFLAGIQWRYIVSAAAAVVGLASVYWFYFMHDYQKARVRTFINPEIDPIGAGWNIGQSKIAIGSGGLYGKGWLEGTQSQLEFLPEANTDFIFAVVAEEFGFIGIVVLLALYTFVILRGVHISVLAEDTFTRLIAGAVTMIFFIHVFVNCGMVSGILPIVGMPLPLISYGGTSVVTLLAAFGILMSVAAHKNIEKKL